MNKAVFLDLNGTLISSLTLEEPFHFNLISGADIAVAKLSEKGFVCPVVTIQSRIAKGYFTKDEFFQRFWNFSEQLRTNKAYLEGPYLCPHDYDTVCLCKKPQSFLFQKAALDHNISLRDSFVIGDSIGDALSATKFGGKGCLIRDPRKKLNGIEKEQLKVLENSIFIANSIQQAVDWVLETELNFTQKTINSVF